MMLKFQERSSKCDFWWACGLAFFLLLWHWPTLTLTPGVNHDEVMLNAAARNWTAHGSIALTPLADHGESYATAYYWHPPGHLFLMSTAYRLFGFSIAVTRGVSLASGTFAVGLLFILLRKLHIPRSIATIATLLFIAHPLVWWLCRSGRMDLFAICFGLTAMLVLHGNSEEPISPKKACLAGLLVGIGGVFHVMALVWAPAIVATEAMWLQRISWRNIFLVGAMACLPVGVWISVTFATGSGPAWVEQFINYQLGQRTATSSIWSRIPDELILLLKQFQYVPAVIVILVVGLLYGWDRPRHARYWATGGAVVSFCLIGIVTVKGTGVYPLYWFIWLLPLVAAGIESFQPRIRFWLCTLAFANAAVVQLAFTGVALYQRQARDHARTDRFFSANIRPGTVVLGPEDCWYAIEHAGAQLRIWQTPSPLRHDYYVTYANIPAVQPVGFKLQAELPDIMPKLLGYYWSHTSYSYRIWVPES